MGSPIRTRPRTPDGTSEGDRDGTGQLEHVAVAVPAGAPAGLPAAALSESELDAVFLDCSTYHPGCTTSRAVAAKVRTTLSN